MSRYFKVQYQFL